MHRLHDAFERRRPWWWPGRHEQAAGYARHAMFVSAFVTVVGVVFLVLAFTGQLD